MYVNNLDLETNESIRAEGWPHRYREAECDPWDEFSQIDDATQRAIQQQQEMKHTEDVLFDLGSRRRYDRVGKSWTNGSDVPPFVILRSIVDRVGIPSAHHFTTFEDRLASAAQWLPPEHSTTMWRQALAIVSYNRGLIETAFNRNAVAQIPLEEVRSLASRLKSAIDYGRARLWTECEEGEERASSWAERVRCQIELLSRLTVRLDPDEAETYFRWGLTIAHDSSWRNWWLYEGLDHLLERSLSAIPRTRYPEFVRAMIDLPFSHEKGDEYGQNWPELARTLVRMTGLVERPLAIWDSRIAAIIRESYSGDRFRRTSALYRLLVLYKAGVLSEEERKSTARALWGSEDGTHELPANTEFYPHVFLELPELRTGQAAEAFEAAVVDALLSGTAGPNALTGLSAAAAPSNGDRQYRLTREKALALATRLTTTRPLRPITTEQRRNHAPGHVMANAVLPALDLGDLPTDFPSRLLQLAEEVPAMMIALPYLVVWNHSNESAVMRVIRRGMASREEMVARLAVHAVLRWSLLASEARVSLPSRIVGSIINLCDFRRGESLLPALEVAREIFKMGKMNRDEEEHLLDALDLLFDATDYSNQGAADLDPMTLSLVRAECVRLAQAVKERGRNYDCPCMRWIEAAPGDPLPEVRFALIQG